MSSVCSAAIRHESAGSNLQPTLWAAAAAVALMLFGPMFVGVLRPPPDAYPDFVQEWLSARNFWAGETVYQPQRDAMLRHTGRDLPAFETEMRWNAHPPVAVLAALPFGLIPDYRAAHLAWNACTLVLFLGAVWIVVRELRIEWKWWSVFPATVLLVCANPVVGHLFQGQLNFLLAFLIVAGWSADRRDRPYLAGLAAGTAVALKLFPGLLLVYFLAARRWRALGTAIIVAIALNGAALAAFGWQAIATYIREVIPSLELFRGSWSNVSISGYWRRIAASVHAPWLGPVLGGLCQFALVAVIVLAGRRASTTDARDRAYSLAIVGMILASPVAWGHYFGILVLPLFLLWQRLPPGTARSLLYTLVIVLCLPGRTFAGWAMGKSAAAKLENHLPTPDDTLLAIGAFGGFTYALVALFLLLALARFGSAEGDTAAGPR